MTDATVRTPAARLEDRLEEIRAEGRAALVCYGVAGYPDRAVARPWGGVA